jgi:aspartate aminotransferase
MKLSEKVSCIQPSATLAVVTKVVKMKESGEKVISFGAGEPDFETPEFIKEAAIKAIRDGKTHYTPIGGITELRKAVAKKFKEDNNIDYLPEEIVVSNGAKHSLTNAIEAIVNPGDEVIVSSPYWVSYSEMIRLAKGVPVFVETKFEEGFLLRAEEVEKKITDKTKAIIVNSPSNPTGCVMGYDELKKIGELAVKYNIIIISDEIYEKLVYGEKHISIASISPEIKERTITINGVSKAYAMTGWRIGYLGAPKNIAKGILDFQGHMTSNPNSIAQYATIAALEMDKGIIESMRKEFEKRRDYMYEALSKIKGFKLPPKPEGAFYIYVNIEEFKMTSLEFADYVLEKAHVAIVPGAAFGMENFVRLSYANSLDEIKEGMEMLKKIELK